ncbi:TLD-domain-containing protein [Spinellus fusiger]|nr:TLD-domain-containing protein [Spinellus fusiger]
MDCIELRNFLAHLELPPRIEPAGILLFKSFSYLGSFPNCIFLGAVPLSLDAFITAFVLLLGRLDTEEECLFDSIFFESLAILPVPRPRDTLPDEKLKAQEVVEKTPTQIPREISLADLKVQFDEDDLDFENETLSQQTKAKEERETLEKNDLHLLRKDLVHLFELLLWIVEMEKSERVLPQTTDARDTIDYDAISDMAECVVASLAPIDPTSKQDGSEHSISYSVFQRWKERNAPHLFKTLQSFIYSKFAVYTQHSMTAMSDLVLKQDMVPLPDASDILNPLYCSLLCWRLPEMSLHNKQWRRLYSGDQNGFSMNRFESHVFKYPDPTLVLIQAEATLSSTFSSSSSPLSPPVHLILGAYIPEPWKSSKHYWGGPGCFVFELSPHFEVFRPTGRNDHYVYYHSDIGIALGSTSTLPPPKATHHTHASGLNHFLVTLDNSLQSGTYTQEAYPELPTFESSVLRSSFDYSLQVVDIEVFGLGNDKSKTTQQKEWQFEQRESLKRASVQFRRKDQTVDKELLRMAGILESDD